MNETVENLRKLIVGQRIMWDGDGEKQAGKIERIDDIKDKDYYEFIVREIDDKKLYIVRTNRDDIEVL